MEAFGDEAKKYADAKSNVDVETVWVDILLTTSQHIIGEMAKREFEVLELDAITNRRLYLSFIFVDRVVHVTTPSIMAIGVKDVKLLKQEQDAMMQAKLVDHVSHSFPAPGASMKGVVSGHHRYYGNLL